MATIEDYNKDGLHEDIRAFQIDLAKKFPDYRITSGLRPGAKTKQRGQSRHATGEALDIGFRKDIRDFLWETPEGLGMLNKYGLGLIDKSTPEMLKKTGGTGAHLHIGKDSSYVTQAQKKYQQMTGSNTLMSDMYVTPYMNKTTPSITNTVSNLPETKQNSTFVEEEPKQEEGIPNKDEILKAQMQQELNEYNLKKEIQNRFMQTLGGKAQEQVTLEPEQYNTPPVKTVGQIYNEASNIVGQMQQGGQLDIYGSPIIASSRIDNNEERAYYDPRINRITYDKYYDSMTPEEKGKLQAHENFHAYQFANDRTNFDIVHNPEYSFQSRLQKKPQMMTTEDVYNNYHNRKQREVEFDVENIKKYNQGFEFIPDQLIYDKIVDPQQYGNNRSVEGEAQHYQETGQFPNFQQGGELDDIKVFYKEYLNSPNYKKRLSEQGYINPEKTKQERLKKLDEVRLTNFRGIGSQYFPRTKNVNIDEEELKLSKSKKESTKAHEFSHVVGSMMLGYNDIKNPNLALNSKEINKINSLNQYRKIDTSSNNKSLTANQAINIDHDALAPEAKANIDALRYMLNKDKVYNTGTETFKTEHLQKAKKLYSKDNILKRNFEAFKDKDLIWLMNNIAENNQNSTEVYAQQGGQIPISSDGVYQYPMSEVIVPTPDGRITMQNIDYPILGTDEHGNQQMMMPDKNYKFPGKVIHEVPQLQNYFKQKYKR